MTEDNKTEARQLTFDQKQHAANAQLKEKARGIVVGIEDIDLILAFRKPTRQEYLPYSNLLATEASRSRLNPDDVVWGKMRSKREELLETCLMPDIVHCGDVSKLKELFNEYPEVASELINKLDELMTTKLTFL